MLKIVRTGQSSRKEVSPPVLSVVTQLSIDRLDRLEQICSVWGIPAGRDVIRGSVRGAVIAAIFDEDRSADDVFRQSKGNRTSQQLLSELESRVERGGVSTLKSKLVRRFGNATSNLYPINELRNIALSTAESEFVLLLDVDCIPSADSFRALCGDEERLSALQRLCIDEAAAIVLPCFERPSAAQEDRSFNEPCTTESIVRLYIGGSGADCTKSAGPIQPFMENRFACGHRATNFSLLSDLWRKCIDAEATAMRHFYPISYEEGFEPYVVVARKFVPPYDPILEGYGRNKALHLYHLHRLGFKFVVSTQACLVHESHPPSSDRALFYGGINGEDRPALMACVKERYKVARALITQHCSSWVLDNIGKPELKSSGCGLGAVRSSSEDEVELAPVGSACVFWPAKMSGCGYSPLKKNSINMPKGWYPFADFEGKVSENSEAHEFNKMAALTTFCSVHLHYFPPKLYIDKKYEYPCRIPESMVSANAVFWAVTHLSIDRIDRLRALCSSWRGPLAASVWFPPQLSKVEHKAGMKALRELLEDVLSSNSLCQLRVVAAENFFVEASFPWRRVVVNHCVDSASLRKHRRVKALDSALSPFPQDMYPVNALRGAAIDIVAEWSEHYMNTREGSDNVTAFVLVLDVDMRPPNLLCKALACTQSNGDRMRDDIIRRCANRDIFIVLPALEVVEDAATPFGDLTKTSESVLALLQCGCKSKLSNKIVELHEHNSIRPFHATTFPAGHASTLTDHWIRDIKEKGDGSFSAREHGEGWEPYGILSLACLQRIGGYNRCFVGWHKDKIEFIRRLAYSGTRFEVYCDPRAFVLDWKPHEMCHSRKLTSNCRFYIAANEGLYRRSLNQMKAMNELDVESAWRKAIFAAVNDTADAQSTPMLSHSAKQVDELIPLFSSLGMVLWTSIKEIGPGLTSGANELKIARINSNHAVTVCLNEKTNYYVSYDESSGALTIPMTAVVLIPPLKGLSFPMKVFHSPWRTSHNSIDNPQIIRTATALGLRYKVRFSPLFDWGNYGGTLPGLELICFSSQEQTNSYLQPACLGRFLWLKNGAIKFKLSFSESSTKELSDFAVSTNDTVQLYRGCWHELIVHAWIDGRIFAFVDGHLVYFAIYKKAFVSFIGVRMCVISEREVDPVNESVVELKDIIVAGNVDTGLPSFPNSIGRRTFVSMTKDVIATDVTVIFGPKETHSTACDNLQRFLLDCPRLAGLVIVIAPPIDDVHIQQLLGIARKFAHPECTFTTYQAEDYQNPYEVRNAIASSLRTKYVLHLNNDVLSVNEFSKDWLLSLVDYAERCPSLWVVVPLLLEQNSDGRFLHVWWDETSLIRNSNDDTACPKLHARFNNYLTQLSIADVQQQLFHRTKPLLFLEDHAILARVEHFSQDFPLFDPMTCYRREFFDIAWGIRARGGDFGMDLNAVVIYEKIQPLSLCDVPFFMQRRQCDLCVSSQNYLNRKWRIDYDIDSWQDTQVEKAFEGLDIDVGSVGRNWNEGRGLSSFQHVELIISMLVVAGMNRFGVKVGLNSSSNEDAGYCSEMKMKEFLMFLRTSGRDMLYKCRFQSVRKLITDCVFHESDSISSPLRILRGISECYAYQDELKIDKILQPVLGKTSILFKLTWLDVENAFLSVPATWKDFAKIAVVSSCPDSTKSLFGELLRPFLLVRFEQLNGSSGASNCDGAYEAWFWISSENQPSAALTAWDLDAKKCLESLATNKFLAAPLDPLSEFYFSYSHELSKNSSIRILNLCYSPLPLCNVRSALQLLS